MQPIEKEKFYSLICKLLKKPNGEIQDHSILLEIVGESLILVDLMMQLQENYPVRLSMEDVASVKTAQDLYRVFSSLPSFQSRNGVQKS